MLLTLAPPRTTPSNDSSLSVVNVMLIDADALLSDALMASGHSSSTVRFGGAATTLPDGLAQMRRFRPQFVLVSGDLFIEGFRALCDDLLIRLGETRLGVYADRLTDSQLQHALSSRLSGLFSRRVHFDDLATGITEAARGKFHVAEPLRGRVEWSNDSVPHVPARDRLSLLTDRQLEVLVHLATGDTVREIASKMHLSEKAVESHKFRIMNRLGINNRVLLCRWAIREGLISP